MELKTGKLILFRGPPQLRDARNTTDLSFILYDNHAITFILSLQFLSQLFFPMYVERYYVHGVERRLDDRRDTPLLSDKLIKLIRI